MKGSDKFLLAILAGIGLLVIIALVLVLRMPEPSYVSDDSPEGVVHNYLLALRNGDYERAYGYLSPDLAGLPDVAGFANDIQENRWQFERGGDVSFAVQGTQQYSDGTVRAEILVTNFSNGLFGGSQYSRTFGLTLSQVDGAWRLIDGEDYWYYCWTKASCTDQPSPVN